MPPGTKVGFGPGDIVLDGSQVPLSKKGDTAATNFRPMYCGQTAGWIKMPLGTEVGLSPGHSVLDGTHLHPSTSKKGEKAPSIFGSCIL